MLRKYLHFVVLHILRASLFANRVTWTIWKEHGSWDEAAAVSWLELQVAVHFRPQEERPRQEEMNLHQQTQEGPLKSPQMVFLQRERPPWSLKVLRSR